MRRELRIGFEGASKGRREERGGKGGDHTFVTTKGVRRGASEAPFEATFEALPPLVKCYLRICDLFFDLLSYMTTLTLVVLLSL